jgi:hypothetical protein
MNSPTSPTDDPIEPVLAFREPIPRRPVEDQIAINGESDAPAGAGSLPLERERFPGFRPVGSPPWGEP